MWVRGLKKNKKGKMETKQDETKRMRELYHAVFGTEDGKKVLRHMLKNSGVLSRTYTGDVYALAWSEGRRSFALQVAQTVLTEDQAIEEMTNMMEERII
jgi:hypothetical protein